MRYVFSLLILISCAPDSGKKIIETETEHNLSYRYENGWLAINDYAFGVNIGEGWKHIHNKQISNRSILFVKNDDRQIQLHCKLIMQDENKFSENLTRLQKTYSHLFEKWVFLDEKLERIENKKTYFLKFMFTNNKLKLDFICEVYNIQLNPGLLLTITLKYPESRSKSAGKIFSNFPERIKFENNNLLSINKN